MAPYQMAIAPYKKARVISPVLPDQIIEPLCNVIADKIDDKSVKVTDLESEDKVLYQFLQAQ